MRKDDSVYVSVPMEHVLSLLFGKANYHGYVNVANARTWKRNLAKIAKYIRVAVEANVRSDERHRAELLTTCDNLSGKLDAAQTPAAVNQAAIECLIRVVFLLLGDFPNHRDYKAPYRRELWKLDQYRSLQYGQTAQQKVRLLIHAVDERKAVRVDLDGHQSLRHLYAARFTGDPDAFLAWFKRERPAAYCEVF